MPEPDAGNVPNLDDLTSMFEPQESAAKEEKSPEISLESLMSQFEAVERQLDADKAIDQAPVELSVAEPAEQRPLQAVASEAPASTETVRTEKVRIEAAGTEAVATDGVSAETINTETVSTETASLGTASLGTVSTETPQPIPVVLTEVVAAEIPGAAPAPAAAAPGTIRHGESQGGIEILVELAAKGDIDPKDIDIIEVTDLFLRAIAAAPKENLRQSGKILFHASVLLRMKAEAWLDLQDEPLGDDFLEFDADGSPIIYDSQREPIARQITIQDLERALVRRSHIHQIRTRRVTLEQLIEALREAERLEKFRLQRKAEPRIELAGHHEVNDVEDILELAHEEDIETVIAKVEQILAESLNPDELTPFIKLIKLLDRKGDWVDAFLAVLFLSNAGKITLQQEQFYGPLFISRAEAQATPAVPQPS